jgi:hypothetical protein
VQNLHPSDFEVIETTGATGGPRAPGRPVADAGPDQTLAAGVSATTLAGSLTGTATTRWSAYPGNPGAVAFGDATALASSAAFSAPGTYTLLLTASDATLGSVYDAMRVTVTSVGTVPVPVLDAVEPTGAVSGASDTTLTLSGSAFAPGCTVSWTGRADLVPVTVQATAITVVAPAAYLASAQSVELRVVNPTPGGGASAPRSFVITAGGSGGGTGVSGGSSGGGGCGAASGLAALVALAFACALARSR